jgi:hypothetical protein
MAVVAGTHRAGRSRVALGGCRLYKASCVPAASSHYAIRAMIIFDLVRQWGVGNSRGLPAELESAYTCVRHDLLQTGTGFAMIAGVRQAASLSHTAEALTPRILVLRNRRDSL